MRYFLPILFFTKQCLSQERFDQLNFFDGCIQNGCQYSAITARESATLILRSNHLRQTSKYLHSTSELIQTAIDIEFGVQPGDTCTGATTHAQL